jgi:hypothetical protein
MYDCMRSESEWELGNQLPGILRKTNKQTCILGCLCMYVYEERERISFKLVTTAAQGCLWSLDLKCVCDVRASAWVLVLFCWSLLCLFV